MSLTGSVEGGRICESKNKNEESRHTWCEGGVPVEVDGIVRELTERIFLCGIVGRGSCYGGGTGLEWLGMGGEFWWREQCCV